MDLIILNYLNNIKQFPDNELFKQMGVDTNNEEECIKIILVLKNYILMKSLLDF